jgi:hypothetical protein
MSTPAKAAIWIGAALVLIALVFALWLAPWFWCQGPRVGMTAGECSAWWREDAGQLIGDFWGRLFTFRL